MELGAGTFNPKAGTEQRNEAVSDKKQNDDTQNDSTQNDNTQKVHDLSLAGCELIHFASSSRSFRL